MNLEHFDPDVRLLIEEGRKKGHLTYEEINHVLPDDLVSHEKLDTLIMFLDELGELAPPLQSKLLRAIQEREVRPLGSSSALPVDVRIVAATNRNLEAEVAAGRFRADLFYRVRVVSIAIPPLRERRP